MKYYYLLWCSCCSCKWKTHATKWNEEGNDERWRVCVVCSSIARSSTTMSSTLLSYAKQTKRPIGNKKPLKNIVHQNNYIESFCLMFLQTLTNGNSWSGPTHTTFCFCTHTHTQTQFKRISRLCRSHQCLSRDAIVAARRTKRSRYTGFLYWQLYTV